MTTITQIGADGMATRFAGGDIVVVTSNTLIAGLAVIEGYD